jgi:mono/diheme cytochrome c family protein
MSILSVAAMLLVVSRFSAAADHAAASAQDNSADAEQMIAANCEMCHTDQLIRQQHLGPNLWLTEVKKMKSWGAPLEENKIEVLAAYLSKLYGVDSAAFAAPAIPAAHELDTYNAVGGTPSGNASRGHSLYKENCASCHGEDALGAIGPRLADMPDLWRWKDYETAVMAGRGKMPSFRGALDLQQTADILAWLRSVDIEPEKNITK